MNIINIITQLFKPKNLLEKGTRIRLGFTEGANISVIPTTAIYELCVDDYVSISHHCTLIYSHETRQNIYFMVKIHWVELQHEAPTDSIVYFTKERFENNLIYRKV